MTKLADEIEAIKNKLLASLLVTEENILGRMTASVRPPAPGGAHAEKIAHGGCQHVWGPFVCDPVCLSNDGRTCTRCGAFQGE